MNRELIAIRNGQYDLAISLATRNLKKQPDNIASHFTLAQSYEAIGFHERALEHATVCLGTLPESFEALSLSARCAVKLELYGEAYQYAQAALKDNRDPSLSPGIKMLFKNISYTGVKGCKGYK